MAARDETAIPSRKRKFITFLLMFAALTVSASCLYQYQVRAAKGAMHGIYEQYLNALPTLVSWILGVFGEDSVRTTGTYLATPHFSMNLKAGCDGLEPVLIFSSAVLAFPASLRSKLAGLGIGIAVLLAANVLRGVALYYVGASYPQGFEAAHRDFLPTLLILLALGFWLVWAARLGGLTTRAAVGAQKQ
jgi:exosortase/archaeosortase family protein